MTIPKLVTFALLVVLTANAQADSGDENKAIQVMDPFARAAPRVMKNGAAYMTLRNVGTAPVVLTGASSRVAARSELHQSKMDGAMMKMLPIDKLVISPKEVVQFQPGGYHIMLMGLKHELREGDHFSLTLHFSDGSERRIEVPVRAMGAMPMHQHQPGHTPKPGDARYQQPTQGG